MALNAFARAGSTSVADQEVCEIVDALALKECNTSRADRRVHWKMGPDVRAIGGGGGLFDEVGRQWPVLNETAVYAMFQVVCIQINGALFAAGTSVEPDQIKASNSRSSMIRGVIRAWISVSGRAT